MWTEQPCACYGFTRFVSNRDVKGAGDFKTYLLESFGDSSTVTSNDGFKGKFFCNPSYFNFYFLWYNLRIFLPVFPDLLIRWGDKDVEGTKVRAIVEKLLLVLHAERWWRWRMMKFIAVVAVTDLLQVAEGITENRTKNDEGFRNSSFDYGDGDSTIWWMWYFCERW